jgi:hypothetical protein
VEAVAHTTITQTQAVEVLAAEAEPLVQLFLMEVAAIHQVPHHPKEIMEVPYLPLVHHIRARAAEEQAKPGEVFLPVQFQETAGVVQHHLYLALL